MRNFAPLIQYIYYKLSPESSEQLDDLTSTPIYQWVVKPAPKGQTCNIKKYLHIFLCLKKLVEEGFEAVDIPSQVPAYEKWLPTFASRRLKLSYTF